MRGQWAARRLDRPDPDQGHGDAPACKYPGRRDGLSSENARRCPTRAHFPFSRRASGGFGYGRWVGVGQALPWPSWSPAPHFPGDVQVGAGAVAGGATVDAGRSATGAGVRDAAAITRRG
jgi:hypothetical protein